MNLSQVSVHGTLRADGTLALEEPLALPPGPVEVVVRALPAAQAREETWWEYLQRGRAELLAQGCSFRSQEAIDADRTRDQDLDRARQLALDSLHRARE